MRSREQDIVFEDALSDDWHRDVEVAEIPLGNRSLWYFLVVVAIAVLAVAARIVFLNFDHSYYVSRAAWNVAQEVETPAPRGLIYDSTGDILADNMPSFSAILDVHGFLTDSKDQSSTLAGIQSILNIPSSTVWSLIGGAEQNDFSAPVVLAQNLDQREIVDLQASDPPNIRLKSDFIRIYPNGPVFSSVVGYTGSVTASDLAADPGLRYQDLIGKAGVEEYYDAALRGTPGINITYTDAQGKVLGATQKSTPKIGSPLTLTIDGGLQSYIYQAMSQQLAYLGRTVGVAIAMDPRTGAILSLVNLPSYDNNVFSEPGQNAAIAQILTSPDRPLFDRAVSGNYSPGSTIKMIDAVGGLAEGVISSTREIYSPGYILVPNPYDPTHPTRYLDWQYQGTVDLAHALAQSSDVYFYLVGGGSPAVTTPLLNSPLDYGISGLGINGLSLWWRKFGLGKPTGIDLPGEANGFLPGAAWKEKQTGRPWLLGDTYNVAIGQGSLLVTPIQLIDYVSAIANGGDVYRPFLNASSTPVVAENLTAYLPEIQQVQQGMVDGVSYPQGTSYTLHDLPLSICAKTGSAQIKDNAEENAFFVGYAPCNDPQIALLVLIENSKQGSLNAVPVAGKILNWYYENRMK
jgi:penicillin-binding protein 2